MTEPHEVLDLPPDCSEEEVRRRYLELVRRHPPDRDPQRFREIHDAYDLLRDPQTRLQRELFQPGGTEDSLDDITMALYRRLRATRIPLETLLTLADP